MTDSGSDTRRSARHWLEYLSAFATAGAAIGAAAAAIFAAQQASISSRQAEIASETAELQLRAYISVTVDPDVPLKIGDRNGFLIGLNIANLGSTPAYDLKSKAALTADYPPPAGAIKALDSSAILGGGGQKFPIRIYKNGFDAQRMKEFLKADGNKKIVSGVVTYKDIFKKAHTLKFAFLLTFDPEDEEFNVVAYRAGNEAD